MHYFDWLWRATCKTCCCKCLSCRTSSLTHTNAVRSSNTAKRMAVHEDCNFSPGYFLWLYPGRSRRVWHHSLRHTAMLASFVCRLLAMSLLVMRPTAMDTVLDRNQRGAHRFQLVDCLGPDYTMTARILCFQCSLYAFAALAT